MEPRVFKLKKKRVVNPSGAWVRSDGCFQQIVDPGSFFQVQGILQERARRLTDAEMIERLEAVLRTHGSLSAPLIDDTEGTPSSTSYRSRFGSLLRAYQLAGFRPDRDLQYLEVDRRLRERHPHLLADILQDLESVGAAIQYDEGAARMWINGLYSTSLFLARCRQPGGGALRWLVKVPLRAPADITLVVRMDPANEMPSDYYLFPRFGVSLERLVLRPDNGAHIDTFRFETLDFFREMAICQLVGRIA